MLLIKNHIGDAGKLGLGLFTDQDLKIGDIIWQEDLRFDRKFTLDEFNALPEVTRDYLREYSPFDGQYYYLDGDFTKHMNHSFIPNVRFKGDKAYVVQDLKKGDQLFTDYSDFDISFRNGDFGFLVINSN